MKRREFIAGVIGSAASCPLAARAQRSTPVIGFLHSAAPEANVKRLAAFRKGLADMGYVEDQNVVIEYRWARNGKLAESAAELVRLNVALIATPGSTPAAHAAKAATSTIPIVFGIGADPVASGLVASLSRPGGNLTGVTSLNVNIAPKRLSMLRELVPKAATYAALINPTSELSGPATNELLRAAAALGIPIEILKASTDSEIEAVIANVTQKPNPVMVFTSDPFFYARRKQIGELALRRKLPTIFDVRDYVDDGGLISYGADFLHVMELAGNYAGRILKGEKPGDLPVQQATKFELVINTKTAKALGVHVPDQLLYTADAVIE